MSQATCAQSLDGAQPWPQLRVEGPQRLSLFDAGAGDLSTLTVSQVGDCATPSSGVEVLTTSSDASGSISIEFVGFAPEAGATQVCLGDKVVARIDLVAASRTLVFQVSPSKKIELTCSCVLYSIK